MIYRILYSLLHGSADIRNRVGARIYPERVPAGVEGECIVVSHVSSEVENHLQNESDCAIPTIQLDFYSNTVTTAESGYQLIRNLLSGFRGDVVHLGSDGEEETTHISGCNLIGPGMLEEEPADGSDQWIFSYSADFQIFHSQSVPTHA